MKKYLVIVSAALIVSCLYSCKAREKCPAYGYKPTPGKVVNS